MDNDVDFWESYFESYTEKELISRIKILNRDIKMLSEKKLAMENILTKKASSTATRTE